MSGKTKRGIVDFLCAFTISVAVFACVSLVTQADFFSSAVKWDKKSGTLEIFDMKLSPDKKVVENADRIFSVNDVFVFDGFSQLVKDAGLWTFGYVSDAGNMMYTAVKGVVGGQ